MNRTQRTVLFCVPAMLGLIMLVNCSGGGDDNGDPPPNGGDPNGNTQSGSAGVVVGRVSTVDGAAVANAGVTLSVGRSSTTDDNGFFSFDGFTPGDVVVARVTADGFAASSLSIPVVDRNRAAPICLFLAEAGETVTISADSGMTQREGDSAVTLPANALVDDDGNPVSGDVELTTTFIDPSSEEVMTFPGSFDAAADTSGNGVTLESFGFAIYELTQDGEPVNLAPGETATIEYVLPDNAQDRFSQGDTIPLWEFDDDTAMWNEAGDGTIGPASDGSGRLAWFAEVEHFSAWNCDAPITDKHSISGRVIISGGDSAVGGAEIAAVGETYNGTSTTRTDANGRFCVDVKRGSTVTLEVRVNGAGTPVHTEMVSTPDESSACPNPGVDVGDIDIDFNACVSGVVTDSEGSPSAGVKVYLVPGETVTTASDGTYCGRAAANADVAVFAEGRPSISVQTGASGTCGGSCAEANLTLTLPEDGDRVGSLFASDDRFINPTFGDTDTFSVGGSFLVADAEELSSSAFESVFPGVTTTTETIGACTVTRQEVLVIVGQEPDSSMADFGGIGALDPGNPGTAGNGSTTIDLFRGDPNQTDPPQPFFAGIYSPNPLEQSGIDAAFSGGQTITFRFPGGSDIGPFEGAIRLPDSIIVTSPDLEAADLSLDFGSALTVRWNAGSAGDTVSVALFSSGFELVDLTMGSIVSTFVTCEFPDTGSGTVPREAMARLDPLAPTTSITVTRSRQVEIEVPLRRVAGTGIVDIFGRASIGRLFTTFTVPDVPDVPDLPDVPTFDPCDFVECPEGTVCNPDTFLCE